MSGRGLSGSHPARYLINCSNRKFMASEVATLATLGTIRRQKYAFRAMKSNTWSCQGTRLTDLGAFCTWPGRLSTSTRKYDDSGFGLRVSGIRFRVSGFGFRVSVFGFRVSGFGFRVSGFGFRVSDLSINSLETAGMAMRSESPESRSHSKHYGERS